MPQQADGPPVISCHPVTNVTFRNNAYQAAALFVFYHGRATASGLRIVSAAFSAVSRGEQQESISTVCILSLHQLIPISP